MNIQLNQWQLCNWTVHDIPAIVKYASNFNIWINLRDSFPYLIEKIMQYNGLNWPVYTACNAFCYLNICQSYRRHRVYTANKYSQEIRRDRLLG